MKPISLRPDYWMAHLKYLDDVADYDVAIVNEKEKTYQGSWKQRGGIGAFMMMARKWDRLENILTKSSAPYDIFTAIKRDPTGADGSALAEVRDLRQYLLLIEAEMMASGAVVKHGHAKLDEPFVAGTPEDGGHHSSNQEE
jgi:hypothetical protein